MPVYRWDAIAADDFRWLRDRARRGADLYDGCASITWSGSTAPSAGRATAASRSSRRANEADQIALGERMLEIFREPGAEIIAEDLGMVPDYVRESLARIGMPGFRVLQMGAALALRRPAVPRSRRLPGGVGRRHRHARHRTDGGLVGPAPTPTSGGRSPTSRRCSVSTPASRTRPFDPAVRDALLEVLFASGSDLFIAADSGRLRLARPDQRAGEGRRRELDLPTSVAVRPSKRSAGRIGTAAVPSRVVRTLPAHIIRRDFAMRDVRRQLIHRFSVPLLVVSALAGARCAPPPEPSAAAARDLWRRRLPSSRPPTRVGARPARLDHGVAAPRASTRRGGSRRTDRARVRGVRSPACARRSAVPSCPRARRRAALVRVPDRRRSAVEDRPRGRSDCPAVRRGDPPDREDGAHRHRSRCDWPRRRFARGRVGSGRRNDRPVARARGDLRERRRLQHRPSDG